MTWLRTARSESSSTCSCARRDCRSRQRFSTSVAAWGPTASCSTAGRPVGSSTSEPTSRMRSSRRRRRVRNKAVRPPRRPRAARPRRLRRRLRERAARRAPRRRSRPRGALCRGRALGRPPPPADRHPRAGGGRARLPRPAHVSLDCDLRAARTDRRPARPPYLRVGPVEGDVHSFLLVR